MAVRLRMRMAGVTREQYDAAHAEMRLDLDPPPGLIFHGACWTEDGWDIVDFWESREQFEEFALKTLAPAYRRQGLESLPGLGTAQIEELPAYAWAVPGGTSAGFG